MLAPRYLVICGSVYRDPDVVLVCVLEKSVHEQDTWSLSGRAGAEGSHIA
jgi:hypothetical protein